MSTKKLIITSIISTTLFVLIILGISYAFFNAIVINDTGSTIIMEAGVLSLEYDDTIYFDFNNVTPGNSLSKEIRVYNKGTVAVNYDLIWVSLINNFIDRSDLIIKITCSSDNGTCNGLNEREVERSGNNLPIITNIPIVPKETHTYLVTISFIETGSNQEVNQGKSIKGQIGAREYGSYSSNTLDDILASNKIISDNILNSGDPDFNSIATSNEGLYRTTDQDGTTYYFRGNVDNNYLSFADFMWRIVRINGDGSIRIILDDLAYDENSSVLLLKHNNNDNCLSEYVDSISKTIECVKYGHGEFQNDSIKKDIDNWYYKNIYGSNLTFINENAKYCNDYSYSTTYFGAYYRLVNNKIPSLMCTAPSEYTNGEAKTLILPVGLLSADEIALAGGKMSVNNTSYYLYKDYAWATMTPYSWSSESKYAGIIGASNYSSSLYIGQVSNYRRLRPVINLIKEVILTGDGTITNPYKIIGT